jgi:hypothetical protein
MLSAKALGMIGGFNAMGSLSSVGLEAGSTKCFCWE